MQYLGAAERSLARWLVVVGTLVAGTPLVVGQDNVIFHESFSTDGDGSRYVMENRGFAPVTDRLPNGWEHTFSLPGIEPGESFTFPARRIAVPWSGTIPGGEYTPTAISVLDSAVNWAGGGNTELNVALLARNGATAATLDPGDLFLFNRLVGQGYTVTVADSNSLTSSLVANNDLLLLSDTASTKGLYREVDLRNVDIPVVNYHPQLANDLVLTASSGGVAPSNEVLIRNASHPSLPGGMTNGQEIGWTTGTGTLPTFGAVQPGVSLVGTYNAKFATSVDRLAVVDAMLAGLAASTTEMAQVTEADFHDSGSVGLWQTNHPIPGDGGDNFALVGTGQISVPRAGTYAFGLGGDDGGRLRINGQDVIVDDSLHGFGYRVGQVELTAGTHNLEWVGFELGGDAGFELAVSTFADQTAVDDVLWEVLGPTTRFDGITLSGSLNVTAHYLDVENSPLLPSNQSAIVAAEAGTMVDIQRSPFRTVNGEYLFAKDTNAAGLSNPEALRTITFDPVDLAGVADPKLTVSLAANVAAWNRADHLTILVNGQPLATFTPDQLGSLNHNGVLLSSSFKNLTYDLPDGLTQAQISMQVFAPDGDQLIGIDEVRISDGPIEGLSIYQTPTENSFQQGIRGYTGTVDTEIWQSRPNDSHPVFSGPEEIAEGLSLDPDSNDDGGAIQVLIRFDNIFGSNAGQIPTDKIIKSARLSFEVFGEGDPLDLHRMLKPWQPSDSWNSLTNGIQTDGVEAVGTPESTSDGHVDFGQLVFDVTESLRAFQDNPSTNYGWVIIPKGGDAVNVLSSEVVTLGNLINANALEQIVPLLEFELGTLVAGDLDGDEDVDIADMLDFLENFTGADYNGPPLSFEDGDLDGDGDVDTGDMIDFLANWTGAQALPGTGSILSRASGELQIHTVPEPSAGLLAGGGLVAWGWARRRRS